MNLMLIYLPALSIIPAKVDPIYHLLPIIPLASLPRAAGDIFADVFSSLLLFSST